jgi:predicted O-methyltransferase YrrM
MSDTQKQTKWGVPLQITQDLTYSLVKSLNTIYQNVVTDPMMCVEIGSFEGKGSIVIAEHLCKNQQSKLYCIDPLDDEYVKGDDRLAFWNYACVGQRARFLNNTKAYPNIVLYQGISDTMIPSLEDGTIDFVYIDGDHSPEQVYKDAIGMWPKMKKGSVILFDDYQFNVNGVNTADGIDKFLKEKEGCYTLLLQNYQLAIRIDS